MLGIGKLCSLLESLIKETQETNSRLLGVQIKLDRLIEAQEKEPFTEQPTANSPYLDKDGLYNYQFYKKNKVRRENGEDRE